MHFLPEIVLEDHEVLVSNTKMHPLILTLLAHYNRLE